MQICIASFVGAWGVVLLHSWLFTPETHCMWLQELVLVVYCTTWILSYSCSRKALKSPRLVTLVQHGQAVRVYKIMTHSHLSLLWQYLRIRPSGVRQIRLVTWSFVPSPLHMFTQGHTYAQNWEVSLIRKCIMWCCQVMRFNRWIGWHGYTQNPYTLFAQPKTGNGDVLESVLTSKQMYRIQNLKHALQLVKRDSYYKQFKVHRLYVYVSPPTCSDVRANAGDPPPYSFCLTVLH